MPAVHTQQLATIADLDQGPADAAMVEALAMFSADAKNTHLRRASGKVLAAYAIRYQRTPGVSFVLDAWGDLTISLTCDLARWAMISQRGYNPGNSTDKTIKDLADEATKTLDQISDIENRTPRRDPDVVFAPTGDEALGSLASSEGGAFDEADAWARVPGGALLHDGVLR